MASVICRATCKTVRLQRSWLLAQTRLYQVAAVDPHAVAHGHHSDEPDYIEIIGNREIVGYGSAGEENYGDSIVWPYPAIRFKRPESVTAGLLQKEKGDWKALTLQEKKELYRYSHCETFAEMLAPTGQWKLILGLFCLCASVALWLSMALKSIMPPLPATFTDEHRLAMLKRMIDMRVGAVDGLASKWDYEKGRWKD